MFYIYADGEALYYPLTDDLMVLSPTLTLEMGKAGSLTFRIPPTNKRYHDLRKLKTVITVEIDDLEIFRGRVLTDDGDFNNIKTVYCEGNLAYLVDSVQKGVAYTGTVHDFFARMIAGHNARVEPEKHFLAGNITVENRNLIISGKSDGPTNEETDQFDYQQIVLDAITTEWKTTFDHISSCLVEAVGGYLRTRRVGNDTYLDYLQNYEENTTQELTFGVNILDLSKHTSAEDVFSVLIPLGDENLTIADVNDGSDELVDETAVSLYGRIIRTHTFDSVTNPTTLLENGLRFLASRSNIPFELEITAVDLSALNRELEPILVGARVKVKSAPHGIVDELTCYKIAYDLENLANTIYSFGTPRQTLTERYRKDKTKAADTAEKAVAKGGGGSGKKAEEAAIDSVYKEWIDVNPDDPDGHISLGATYNTMTKMRTKLENDLGLDINAVEGAINLKNIRTEVNAAGQEIAAQSARIQLLQEGTQASLSLLVGRTDHLLDLETSHYAEITLRANEIESSIELKADKTEITTELDGIKLTIASFTSKITTIDSEITKVKKLVADEVNALKSNITWLNGKIIQARSISSDSVYTGHIYATEIYIGDTTVATKSWVNAAGFLTDNGVSWGNVSNGFVWLNIDGVGKNMAMGNHTHSEYLKALPSHRHKVSLQTGKLCRLSNGTTGWCVATGSYNTEYS